MAPFGRHRWLRGISQWIYFLLGDARKASSSICRSVCDEQRHPSARTGRRATIPQMRFAEGAKRPRFALIRVSFSHPAHAPHKKIRHRSAPPQWMIYTVCGRYWPEFGSVRCISVLCAGFCGGAGVLAAGFSVVFPHFLQRFCRDPGGGCFRREEFMLSYCNRI